MEKNTYQKIIAEVLGTRVVSYNPDLARVLGSVKAGVLVCQLLYWWKKGKNPDWIYKTAEEIKEETALSRGEQDTAIKKCKELKIIEVKLKGIPAKRHFKLHIEKIVELLETLDTRLEQSKKQDYVNYENKIHKEKECITENTTDITSENTNRQSSSKKKPFYRGEEMRWSQNKWWVIPKEGGSWLEFAGGENEIEWK